MEYDKSKGVLIFIFETGAGTYVAISFTKCTIHRAKGDIITT
jgi:hypothetical protein